MLKKKSLFILASILAILLAYFPEFYQINSKKQQINAFQNELNKKELEAKNQLKQIQNWDQQGLLDNHTEKLNGLYETKGYSFFVFHQSKLAFWSEDATVINVEELLHNDLIYKGSNAWQSKQSFSHNDSTYVALQLIKHNYPIQNRFLINKFQEEFEFSGEAEISSEGNPEEAILNQNGEALFYLHLELENQNELLNNFIAFIFLLGLVCLLILLPKLFTSNKLKQIRITLLLIIASRIFLFYKLPYAWQSIPLFNPNWFAISYIIPTLGDLVLNLIVLFTTFYLFKKILKHVNNKLLAVAYLFMAFTSGLCCIWLINNSIDSSQINFDLNSLFELNSLSLICFLAVIVSFLISLLIIDTSICLIKNSFSKQQSKWLLLISIISFSGVLLYNDSLPIIFAWTVPVYLIMYWFSNRSKSRIIFVSILILLCCSATMAYWSNLKIEQKQDRRAKIILEKLGEEEDPIAEYLFEEAQSEIIHDTTLHQLLPTYWDKKVTIDNYLKSNYFNSYWDSYEILFSLCSPNDSLYVSSWNTSLTCFDYFQNRIRLEGSAVSSSNLFQLKNLAGRVDYIGEITIPKDSINYRLYVELSSNYFNENEGYPELLLDAKSKAKDIDLSNFDYAVYQNNELIFKNGSYNYSSALKINELAPEVFYEYTANEYHHSVYQKDKSTSIILSHHAINKLDFLTAFAYLLVLFALVFLVFNLGLTDFLYHIRLKTSDFSFKIQLFLIGSLFTALILVALGSTYYIQKQYREKNSSNLGEKLRSIKYEMENKVGGEEILATELQGHIAGLLVKFSNVFYTDINFYDKNGNLYASSRPEIFKKGLKSEQMNPIAYSKIVHKNKAEWVQEEQIGKMEYLSAYVPFKNYDNEILGYLNLPYFVKQGELQKEISNFLVSTINIYVAVFALALFISILLINQLSKPLLLIRKQIGRLKIGSSIELIDWKSEDEIGALVKEYNRIAIELNESAERLAQSEREGAWREMAKQVAHEIKNPLTPMKLSIQHLQMAAEQKTDDLNERIKRTTQVLIEQIETLSNIATAFSSFAKLPENSFTKIDVVPILKNICDLYSNDANIKLSIPPQINQVIINADKDQLLRLLNNLMKNAVQASSESKDSPITLSLEVENQQLVITIKDSGIGIKADQVKRIFEPNFTTKSSGTGLGLAMSKNIVEQMNGSIEVESTEHVGTTFWLRFPIA